MRVRVFKLFYQFTAPRPATISFTSASVKARIVSGVTFPCEPRERANFVCIRNCCLASILGNYSEMLRQHWLTLP